MDGKYSLKHLYNNGKSSQIKVKDFLEMIDWLDKNANGMIDEAVEVTEKIDGSSNFIGYDGRIYVEKFGFDTKFYADDAEENPYFSAKAHALLDFANSIPELPEYFKDLCKDNQCSSVKVQIEVLMTKFSKMSDACQIVLVPYELDKLGKDGNGFIIQVLNGDTLRPVKDEKIAIETLCDIMSTENFHVTGTNPKHFSPIDIKEDIQEVKDIIATYTEKMGKSVEEILSSRKKVDAEMKNALKAEIETVQEALQDKLSEAFPRGDYGEYYEGLVFKLTNGMMFKVTSKKFKQFMADHNHWTESMKFKESESSENGDIKNSLSEEDEKEFWDTITHRFKKLSKEDEFDSTKSPLSDNEKARELISKYLSSNKAPFNVLQFTSTSKNSVFITHGLEAGDGIKLSALSKFTYDVSSLVKNSLIITLGNRGLEEKIEQGFIIEKHIEDIFDIDGHKNIIYKTEDEAKEALKQLPEKDDSPIYKVYKCNTSAGDTEFVVVEKPIKSLSVVLLMKDNNGDFYSLTLQETGGKQASAWYYIKTDGNTKGHLLKSSSKKVKVSGITNTDIQECIAGLLIYDKISGNSECDNDANILLADNWLSLKLTGDNNVNKFCKGMYALDIPKGQDENFKIMVNNLLDDSWKNSMRKITETNNIKLIKDVENPFLLRSGINCIGSNVSATKINNLQNILFKMDFLKGTDYYRDEVNPSDIYIINYKKIDKIESYFECVEPLCKVFSSIYMLYVLKGRNLNSLTPEEFIKHLLLSTVSSSKLNRTQKKELNKKMALNSKINKLKSELLEISTSTEVLELLNNNIDEISPAIAFVLVHNYLTKLGLIAGISLKKIKEELHFTFTGGSNFFTQEGSNAISTFAKSRFVFSNKLDNSTIKSCHFRIAKPQVEGTQGTFTITCKMDKSHLNGSEAKGQIETGHLDIRSFGSTGAGIDSRLDSAGAQQGKGTSAFNKLIPEGISIQNTLLNKLLKLNETSNNSLLKEALQDEKTLMSLFQEVEDLAKSNFLTIENEKARIDQATNAIVAEVPKDKEFIMTNTSNAPYKNFWSIITNPDKNNDEIIKSSFSNIINIASTQNDKNKAIAEEIIRITRFLLGNIDFKDANLQKFSDYLKRHSPEEKIGNQFFYRYYPEDLRFRLTVLFAKTFKYQLFIEDDYQFYSLDTDEVGDTSAWTNAHKDRSDLLRNYVKANVNSTIVTYYKIS